MTEARCRKIVAERAGGRCEKCGSTQPVHMHHRIPRSQGGQWTPANVLHLCVFCHVWVTEHPDEAVAHGWSLKSHMTPERVPFQTPDGGWVGIDDEGFIQLTL